MKTSNRSIIEADLLQNEFKYFDDWEHGPQYAWMTPTEHCSMRLMAHDKGYYIVLFHHAGGDNNSMNLGSSDNAEDIIRLRDCLEKLF